MAPVTRSARFGRMRWLTLAALLISALLGFTAHAVWRPAAPAPLSQNVPVQKPAHPYNVILVSLDTLRPDHMSCYGYDRATSPHLDQLSADSLRFEQCLATSNWTLPTHASMFTGLYPEAHGAHFLLPSEAGSTATAAKRLEGRLPTSQLTLAEILSAAGYRTGATIANHGYLHPRFQLDQGFEHYDARRGGPPGWYRPANIITDEAIDWLQAHEFQNRPFFLFLNYMDPHHPYNPPPRVARRLIPELTAQDLAPRDEAYFREMIVEVTQRQQTLTDQQWQWLIDRYDSEIAFMDEEFGRLVEMLKANDLYDETLIIVTSDHGEALGEHTTLGHCFRLHQPEVAVPLLVKLPLRSSVGVRQSRASHVDILPIVLDVLGLPIPAGSPGHTLAQLETAPPRNLFTTKFDDLRMESFPRPMNQAQSAVYRGPLKYIQYPAGPAELFDLELDPDELSNLAGQQPDTVRQLAAALEQHRRDSPPRATLEPAFGDDEAVRDAGALRELGYAQ